MLEVPGVESHKPELPTLKKDKKGLGRSTGAKMWYFPDSFISDIMGMGTVKVKMLDGVVST